jgi:hypothetical protein
MLRTLLTIMAAYFIHLEFLRIGQLIEPPPLMVMLHFHYKEDSHLFSEAGLINYTSNGFMRRMESMYCALSGSSGISL